MASYLITYDLSKPDQNYSDVIDIIKNLGDWAKLSESSYAVTSSLNSTQIYGKIKGHLDKNDQLYVIGLHQPWAGYGDRDVNAWLNDHLDTC